MSHRRSTPALLIGIVLLTSATPLPAAPKRNISPPEMTKLAEAMVMSPLPDGSLVAIFGGSGPDGQTAVARYSSDGGRKWSEPSTLFSLPKEAGVWGCHYVLTDRKGELHLFYTADAKTAGKSFYEMRFDIYHVGSANGRTKWNKPVLVREGYHGSMLSAFELDGGRIVLPICYRTTRVWNNRGTGADAFTDMGRFSSGVVYSDDGGASWKQSEIEFKVPSPYIGADGIIEPIGIKRTDGTAWMLLRTQHGRLYESFSREGEKWSKPMPTRILCSDSPPSLTRLKDGRVVILWNNCQRFAYAQGGRHVLHAAISEDDGRTWRGYREVVANPFVEEPPPGSGDHGVSYTLPVLTADGEIITPLQVGGTGGMWQLRFHPDWLYETHRRTDLSKGLAGWHRFGTKGVDVVPHPDKPGAQVLQLRKPDADWASAAVWNFPNGKSGKLTLRLRAHPECKGVRISLTDHFSVPFDAEDNIHNLFNLYIKTAGSEVVETGKWCTLEFDWNCEKSECLVRLDGKQIETLPMQRRSSGVNYLRLVSTSDSLDPAGLLVESVEVQVTAGD